MKKIIELKNISKIYDKRNTGGISNLNLDIIEGEVLSILGPSGSGKSTLLNILSSKITDFSGELKTLTEVSISYVDQRSYLDEKLSVFDNILSHLSSEIDEEKRINQVRTTLSLFDITNESERLPHELSGGQYQRVIIARAMVTNPTVLLFDEAFGHLDEKLRHELSNEIFPLLKSKDITLINVTHNNNEALSFSDRVLILNFGKVQAIGTPKDLYQMPPNLFCAQFFGFGNVIVSPFEKKGENLCFKLFNREQELSFPKYLKLEKPEGLVVIPEEAFSIASNGNYKAKVLQSYFRGFNTLLDLSIGETFINALIPSHTYKNEEKINFDINLESLKFISEV